MSNALAHSATMSITDHQAKYFAYELTRRAPPDSLEKLAAAVAGAQVDLNPHQVDAALFAFRSPLSKGALLADEVGYALQVENLPKAPPAKARVADQQTLFGDEPT